MRAGHDRSVIGVWDGAHGLLLPEVDPTLHPLDLHRRHELARLHALARRLADGPTRAHDATKQIVRAWCDDGVGTADSVVPAVSGALFATDDLQNAVMGFLAKGPRHGTVAQGR